MNWIEQIEDRSTPSGYAFIFGHRIPRDVQSAYRALHDRLEKNRKTGFLIQVELHSFKNAGKVAYLLTATLHTLDGVQKISQELNLPTKLGLLSISILR